MATDSRVRLSRLSYVIYEHPSTDGFRKFAQDFGFVEAGTSKADDVTYYRGYGEDPYIYIVRPTQEPAKKRFVGAGFVAESADDFAKASQIEGAEKVDLSDRPGGGRSVVLRDPNGFEMVVLWGQEPRMVPERGVSSLVGQPDMNGALQKRRKGMVKALSHTR
jgi:hypothetical protein